MSTVTGISRWLGMCALRRVRERTTWEHSHSVDNRPHSVPAHRAERIYCQPGSDRTISMCRPRTVYGRRVHDVRTTARLQSDGVSQLLLHGRITLQVSVRSWRLFAPPPRRALYLHVLVLLSKSHFNETYLAMLVQITRIIVKLCLKKLCGGMSSKDKLSHFVYWYEPVVREIGRADTARFLTGSTRIVQILHFIRC